MRLLARIGLAQEALDDAQLLLEAVLAIAPDYRAARHDYAQTLIKRQRYLEAGEHVRQLLELDPANTDYRTLDATLAVGLGQHERAIALYRGMIADMPGAWDPHLWLGHALKTVGRTDEAIASCVSPWARRWRIAGRPRTPGSITSAATP
jgi:tetratricopeptide (TPR) repeat protein